MAIIRTLWIGNGAVLKSSSHKVIIIAISYDGMNGIYLYFVNKHLSSWALLGL